MNKPVATINVSAATIRDYVRRERARCMLNAFFALLVLLIAGWVYAQLARLMGYPSPIIGATAVAVQFVVAIFAMQARLGEHFVSLCKGVAMMAKFVAEVIWYLKLHLAVIGIGIAALFAAAWLGVLPI